MPNLSVFHHLSLPLEGRCCPLVELRPSKLMFFVTVVLASKPGFLLLKYRPPLAQPPVKIDDQVIGDRERSGLVLAIVLALVLDRVLYRL